MQLVSLQLTSCIIEAYYFSRANIHQIAPIASMAVKISDQCINDERVPKIERFSSAP
jgi:hypothetical protein